MRAFGKILAVFLGVLSLFTAFSGRYDLATYTLLSAFVVMYVHDQEPK